MLHNSSYRSRETRCLDLNQQIGGKGKRLERVDKEVTDHGCQRRQRWKEVLEGAGRLGMGGKWGQGIGDTELSNI